MTISTTDSRISYNGNGVTTAFSFPYRFLANIDIVVVEVSAAGVETTKTLTTDYTLTGAGDDAGGSVTMLVAPASGTRLIIYRDTDIVQETDYISGDPFPAETHERALDRLTMIAQEIGSDADRSIKVPVGDSSSLSTVLPAAANRLDKFIVFDATTGETELSTVTQTQVASAVAAAYAAGATADAVTFLQEGTGGVSRSVQSKLREVVSVTDFGAVGDGSTDDTTAIQAAIDQAAASSGVVEFVKNHTYKITGTLFKPYKVSLHGNHCQIIPAAGTYTEDFIILTNSTTGLDWTFAYPTNFSGTIRDFWINNATNTVADLIGIGLADSSDIINVRVSYCAGSIYTVASLFLDQKLIDNVYTTYHQGTNPMIKINGFGDMGVISRIICYIPNVSSGVIDCLQLNNAKGTTIQSCAIPTYAAIKLTGCKGIAVNALSLEGGQFNAESSDFVMNGAWVSRVGDTSTSPINLTSDAGATTNQNHATFNNVTFVRLLKRAITTLPEFDITYSSTWRILLNDVHRTVTYNDSVRGAVTSTAPMLYSSTAAAESAYNVYAHALPVAEIPPTLSGELNSFIGRVRTDTTVNWALTIGSASIPFSAATATYYYKVIILLDTVRMIGTPDAAAELSRAITNSTGNDSGAAITGGGTSYRASGFTHILRVYRGTSTGSYDKYVDIPTRAGLTALYDSGGDVNGYPWKSRGAAAADTTYLALTLDASNTQVTAYQLTAAPTVGTWKVGDRVARTPVVGQPNGWRCTVAGTPGTWVAEANL